jgi:hypothetical protein
MRPIFEFEFEFEFELLGNSWQFMANRAFGAVQVSNLLALEKARLISFSAFFEIVSLRRHETRWAPPELRWGRRTPSQRHRFVGG